MGAKSMEKLASPRVSTPLSGGTFVGALGDAIEGSLEGTPVGTLTDVVGEAVNGSLEGTTVGALRDAVGNAVGGMYGGTLGTIKNQNTNPKIKSRLVSA